MPAAIFNGSYVKVLKDEIKAKSGGLFDKVYVSAKSTAFTAAVGYTYLINTGTAVTVTLPSAVTNAAIIFKDSAGTAATNNVTINRADSATIDGATSQAISSNYGSMKLISDGTNWFIT
jgi:hypothetical protein